MAEAVAALIDGLDAPELSGLGIYSDSLEVSNKILNAVSPETKDRFGRCKARPCSVDCCRGDDYGTIVVYNCSKLPQEFLWLFLDPLCFVVHRRVCIFLNHDDEANPEFDAFLSKTQELPNVTLHRV